MSVARAQAEISSAEFAEWQAYDRVEPFGEARADLRAGIIASTVYNMHRGKHSKGLQPAAFMPNFDGPRVMSPDEIRHRLTVWADAQDAKARRR